WGPATFRARTSLIDDAMMYVAKREDSSSGPARYAIAIRGTNPISLFDWVFGDFWVSLETNWGPIADVQPKLSASTALGLAIIQNLASIKPPPEEGVLAQFGNAITHVLEEFAQIFPERDPKEVLKQPSSFSSPDQMTAIAKRAHDPTESVRPRVLD